MSSSATVSSKHLVDPELAAPLDYFTPFGLDHSTLPAVREVLANMNAAAAAHVLVPGVERLEEVIPGAAGDPDVRVLIYRRFDAPETSTGALIWLHGGGFIMGEARDDDATARGYVAATGAVVVAVDYRIAPETPFPGALHDAYAALAWVHTNAERLGVDSTRIAVGGQSAGGGLAANLAVLARDRDEYPIVFQLLLYPMLDDRTSTTAEAGPYQGEFIWSPSDNAFGWRCYLGGEPGTSGTPPYAAAARTESLEGLPPAYIGVGSVDLFAEEDLSFAQRLVAAGVPVELHLYPGGYHGFIMATEARASRAFHEHIAAALSRALEERN